MMQSKTTSAANAGGQGRRKKRDRCLMSNSDDKDKVDVFQMMMTNQATGRKKRRKMNEKPKQNAFQLMMDATKTTSEFRTPSFSKQKCNEILDGDKNGILSRLLYGIHENGGQNVDAKTHNEYSMDMLELSIKNIDAGVKSWNEKDGGQASESRNLATAQGLRSAPQATKEKIRSMPEVEGSPGPYWRNELDIEKLKIDGSLFNAQHTKDQNAGKQLVREAHLWRPSKSCLASLSNETSLQNLEVPRPRTFPMNDSAITKISVFFNPWSDDGEKLTGIRLVYDDGLIMETGQWWDDYMIKSFQLKENEHILKLVEHRVPDGCTWSLEVKTNFGRSWKACKVENRSGFAIPARYRMPPMDSIALTHEIPEGEALHSITFEDLEEPSSKRKESKIKSISTVYLSKLNVVKTNTHKRSMPSLQTLAQDKVQDHFAEMANQLHKQAEEDLDKLKDAATKEVENIYSNLREELEGSIEAQMLRQSALMHQYAQQKMEEKRRALQTKGARQRDQVYHSFMEDRDKYLQDWQNRQETIYIHHRQNGDLWFDTSSLHQRRQLVPKDKPHRRYFQKLIKPIRTGHDSTIVSTERNPFTCPRICCGIGCRKMYVPTDLPAEKRCMVEGCTYLALNCGCGLSKAYCVDHRDPCAICERICIPPELNFCKACGREVCDDCRYFGYFGDFEFKYNLYGLCYKCADDDSSST